MTLMEQINAVKYKADDSQWVQFILDHKQYLIDNSTIVPIDVNTMNTYRYKPYLFLTSKKVDFGMMWIVCFINDCNDFHKFDNLSFLYIPSNDTIYNLRVKFNTFKKDL